MSLLSDAASEHRGLLALVVLAVCVYFDIFVVTKAPEAAGHLLHELLFGVEFGSPVLELLCELH